MWFQTSPSGCQCGSCAQPMSAASSGKYRVQPVARRALRQQLAPLLEEPLGRQVLDRHRPADRHRLRRGVEVEARRELHAAQDAQRVFREARRDVAEDARAEVRPAAVRILEAFRERVVVERVDREVAPRGGVPHGHRGVREDVEPAVARAALRLAPRQRDVDVEVLDLEHAEGRAARVEGVRRAERPAQRLRRDAEDLEVHVLHARLAQEEVAHAAPDHQRPPARGLHAPRDVHDRRALVRRERREVEPNRPVRHVRASSSIRARSSSGRRVFSTKPPGWAKSA